MDRDDTTALIEQVREASARQVPLRIVGGDTKRFYGRAIEGVALETRGHSGVLRHDPAQLPANIQRPGGRRSKSWL